MCAFHSFSSSFHSYFSIILLRLFWHSSYDTLFGMGVKRDPCRHEHVEKQFLSVAQEICKCFRGCSGYKGVPVPSPSPSPASAAEAAAIRASQSRHQHSTFAPSRVPTAAPSNAFRGLCYQEDAPLYADQVSTLTTGCHRNCYTDEGGTGGAQSPDTLQVDFTCWVASSSKPLSLSSFNTSQHGLTRVASTAHR